MKKLAIQPKKGKSIVMRNGIEILLEKEQADNLQEILTKIKEHKFIKIGGRTINTADLVGIFQLEDNFKK